MFKTKCTCTFGILIKNFAHDLYEFAVCLSRVGKEQEKEEADAVDDD